AAATGKDGRDQRSDDQPDAVTKFVGSHLASKVDDERLLGRADDHHADRLVLAHVFLDMRHLRWDPDEISGRCDLRVGEGFAGAKSGLAGNDVDRALALA